MSDTEQNILEERYTEAKELLRSGREAEAAKAMEIFLSLGQYRSSAAMAEKCRMMAEFQPGKTVAFGSWQGKPIRWRVADSSGKMRMLIAEEIVLERPYNDLRVDVYWQSTTLRKWLNKEFIQEAFNKEERLLLIATRRTNEPNEQFYTNAGLPTMDKVFVLSKQELDLYLPNEQERALGAWWWLRTPGDNLLAVEAIDQDGSAYIHGININYEKGGVRPALWVLLKDY